MKVKKVMKAHVKAIKAYNQLEDAMNKVVPVIEEGNEKKLNKHFRRIESKALALADAVGIAIMETDEN